MIRRLTGKNYTELVQNKRLTQAAYLLETTGLSVADIGERVGYENMSYFHRIFKDDAMEYRRRSTGWRRK